MAVRSTDRLRAAGEGDITTLRKTKDSGKITALMVACRFQQRDAVQVLLDNATSINAQSESGCTALYLAAEEGDVLIVNSLLGKGADVSLPASDGGTPLQRACYIGHEPVCAVAISQHVQFFSDS